MSRRLILIYFFLSNINFLFAQSSFYYPVYAQERKQYSADAVYFYTDDFHLIKSDLYGNMIWSRFLPDIWEWSLGDNSIYVLTLGDFLTRIDTAGNAVWSKDVSANSCGLSDNFKAVLSFQDRIFLYWKYSPTVDALLVLDTAGNFVNAWCDNSNILDYEMASICPDGFGGAWAQLIDGPGNGSFSVLAKLDHNGTPDSNVYILQFNICFDEYIEDIIPFNDSTDLLIDNGKDYLIQLDNCGIFKIDANGNELHHKVFGMSADTSFQIARAGIDSLNNVYLILYYYGLNSGFISVKLDSSFNIISMKEWDGGAFIFSMPHYDRMVFYNGSFHCPAEYFFNYPVVYQSFLVLDTTQMQPCGIPMTSTGVSEKNYQLNLTQWNSVDASSFIPLPSNYIISSGNIVMSSNLCSSLTIPEVSSEYILSCFPNPVQDQLKIMIQDEGNNNLEIYSSSGEKKYNLSNVHSQLMIEFSNMPSGVYFLKYQSAKYSLVKKLVKL